MRRVMLICALLLCLAGAAGAQAVKVDAPDVLRPGRLYDLAVDAPGEGMLSVTLEGEDGGAYTIFDAYPLAAGTNTLHWDGLLVDGTPVAPGGYVLRFGLDGQVAESPLRVGAAYPLLTRLVQNDVHLYDTPVTISFASSVEGTLEVSLQGGDGGAARLMDVPVRKGENQIEWDGTIDGRRVADGDYGLLLTLRTVDGQTSMPHQVRLDVVSQPVQEAAAPVAGIEFTSVDAPPPTPSPTAPPQGVIATLNIPSPPYSEVDDGTFWSMTPGELDDAVIWEIMTQPITVYDGGLDDSAHVFLMENPDGSGKKIAQVHPQSQGLHILGEANEHGYVLAETFSNYDKYFMPGSEEELRDMYGLKRGYIRAKHLKTIEVQQDMGLLIDKLTQRMYLFIDGERVTEFIISTGLTEPGKEYQETAPGEFITISHTGTLYTSKYMHCDMAIRISGGTLVHEVPHEPRRDGSKRYAQYEALLGEKASHGCVRVQRTMTPEGYNHQWIWDNFKSGKRYKVLVWDDLGREDRPQVWHPRQETAD